MGESVWRRSTPREGRALPCSVPRGGFSEKISLRGDGTFCEFHRLQMWESGRRIRVCTSVIRKWQKWNTVFREFAAGRSIRRADAFAGRGIRGVCDFDCGLGGWRKLHDFQRGEHDYASAAAVS